MGSSPPSSDHLLADSQVELFRGWSLSLYPAAGEAGGAWVSGRGRGPARGGRPDPERAKAEADRRAQGKLRRYATANTLNRLGTLTYRGEGCHDQRQFRADMARFFRALKGQLGGDRFPYVWVPEWHKSGHGLHAHFAVGRYIGRRKIEAAWPHGFVHIKLLGDLPVGTGPRGEARRAAGYLAKYVGKDFDTPKMAGLHRYDVAQHFAPVAEQIRAPNLRGVVEAACDRMGAAPSYVWQSQSVEDWCGPPAVWLSWD